MAEEPRPLTDLMLDGMERMRISRRMRDAAGERTGPFKVWNTSIADILRFARRTAPTVKSLSLIGKVLSYTDTADKTTELGSIEGPVGKDGAQGLPGKDGAQGLPGKDGLNGTPGLIDLGQITLSRTAILALAAGIRTQTIAVSGVLKDDVVHLSPITAPPAGSLIGQAVVKVAGSIDVPIYEAAMILNASYSFKARVLVLRP